MNPIPAVTNIRHFTMIAWSKDDNHHKPITSGTVNYYAYHLTGTNAGKYYRDSDNTWQAAESVSETMAHVGDGNWICTAEAGIFVDGVYILEYAKESGNLHTPNGRVVYCGTDTANMTQINGGLTTGNNATLSLKQLDIQNNTGHCINLICQGISHNAIYAYSVLNPGVKIESTNSGGFLSIGRDYGIKAHSVSGTGFWCLGELIGQLGMKVQAPQSSYDMEARITGTITSVTGAVNSVTTGVTLANDAITAAKFDESTAFPSKFNDSGVTLLARANGAITTVTGNVTGSVGSVVGNVAGNVTGSVGNVAGNVVGSVGSVVGNVTGNVTGSVGNVVVPVEIAADTITAAKFDELTAFPVAAVDSGLTKISRMADINILEDIGGQE